MEGVIIGASRFKPLDAADTFEGVSCRFSFRLAPTSFHNTTNTNHTTFFRYWGICKNQAINDMMPRVAYHFVRNAVVGESLMSSSCCRLARSIAGSRITRDWNFRIVLPFAQRSCGCSCATSWTSSVHHVLFVIFVSTKQLARKV